MNILITLCTAILSRSTSKLRFSVGNTPLIKLDKIEAAENLFGKAEYLNPTGSVKDRAAAGMLEDAMKRGLLTKGKEILDSSSGNTGISLAAFGSSIGFKVTIVIPESASAERVKMIRSHGANVIFSDPMLGSDGAVLRARELLNESPSKYLYVDQYSNDANWLAHYSGTAEEIWKQTGGKITHFVSGVGTGGTVMGTGRRLKELNPGISIIAVEPSTPLHGIEGLKHIESSIKPRIFDENFPDETRFVETEVAQNAAKWMAETHGIFVGTSSGATVSVAKEYSVDSRNCVVAILADHGNRYLSERYRRE